MKCEVVAGGARPLPAWITLVVAQRFGPERDYLELHIGTEEDRKMTTLVERARKWGEEGDQQWLLTRSPAIVRMIFESESGDEFLARVRDA